MPHIDAFTDAPFRLTDLHFELMAVMQEKMKIPPLTLPEFVNHGIR